MKDTWEDMEDTETDKWMKNRWQNMKNSKKEPVQEEDCIRLDEKDVEIEFGEEKEKDEFAHIYRQKTRLEMVRISASMMGIQLGNAVKTSLVSPTLLKLGVNHRLLTSIWFIGPLLGLFMTPVLGSLSDKSTLRMGRRRPFILVLSIGLLLSLILFPNGILFGILLGDTYAISSTYLKNESYWDNSTATLPASSYNATYQPNGEPPISENGDYHPWGLCFTIIGVVLLDFTTNACQSPARAYLLDVTLPDDHTKGQSTFTMMAGLGGVTGYVIGAIDWDNTVVGQSLGGHLQTVFTFVFFIYIICVTVTITSFKEMPARWRNSFQMVEKEKTSYLESGDTSREDEVALMNPAYLTKVSKAADLTQAEAPEITLKHYLLSIVYMPKSLRIILLTNFFSWNSFLCYTLYFTDFVGEAVFNGDPMASKGSQSRISYEEGVRFGCLGMCLYSSTSVLYSTFIQTLVQKFGGKTVYVCGQLVNSVGLMLMVIFPQKLWVTLLSATAGVMYTTLFTLPYILLADYHEKKIVGFGHSISSNQTSEESNKQIRGLGTDVAIVSSMLFLAQIVQSLFLGSLVQWVGSTVAVMGAASFLAFCGAMMATQAVYLDL